MVEVAPNRLHDRVDQALAALDRIRGSRVSQLSSGPLGEQIVALGSAFEGDADEAIARMRAIESKLNELRLELDRAAEALEALGRRSAVGAKRFLS